MWARRLRPRPACYLDESMKTRRELLLGAACLCRSDGLYDPASVGRHALAPLRHAVRGRSLHAGRGLRFPHSRLGRALDSSGPQTLGAGRRHAAGREHRGALGSGDRRAHASRRSTRHLRSDAAVGAFRSCRAARPRAQPRVLVPLHRRRRAERNRAHAHGAPAARRDGQTETRRRLVSAVRAWLLRRVPAPPPPTAAGLSTFAPSQRATHRVACQATKPSAPASAASSTASSERSDLGKAPARRSPAGAGPRG